MGFFDSVPLPPPPEPEPPAPPPVWVRPDTVIGGSVGADLLLARSDDAAVVLTGLIGYPNGFAFTIAAVLREEDRSGRIHHHGYRRDSAGEPPPPEFLRIGVRFADGRVATNLAGYPGYGETPEQPLMLPDSGGGGGRRYDMSHWVWPLPPAGPLTFVVAWPGYRIDETSAEIDATLLRDAAARALVLG
ncbi:hypothetical protein [Actinoplanes sp. CA-252034]|uniref:hypothetical protein n=1 Tax=Actinoplanes sp. CA-252034 TaxID=3239906 RepID=UPI003D978932